MPKIVSTPNPPYYAVIFTSIKIEEDLGYSQTSRELIKLLSEVEGFLGFETAREDVGITVSYWRDLDSIKRWRENKQHKEAQALGKNLWYKKYKIRVAKVEREYEFEI